jgi:peptidoglycan/LPS O-acetylase OafA/YrhL
MFSRIQLGSERYPALTGVRAFGATAVFMDHFPVWPRAHLTINVMAFFYVLSGFLIVRIYHEQAQLRRQWLAKYFVNRFARIYPVYFLLLTIAVCLQHDFQPWVLIKNYTLTHALFHPSDLIIQPSWSLTVEECFYGLAPLFMVLAKRYNFGVSFALGWLLLAAALIISKLGIVFLETPMFVLSTTFFGHFAEFFAGVYLALLLMRRESHGVCYARGNRFTIAGLAGVALLTFVMLIVYRQTPLNLRAIIIINNFLIPVPIAVLYWGLMRENTALARLLASNICGLLGRSSYSFYLLHTLIIDYLSIPYLLPLIPSRAVVVVLSLAACWLVSVLLFVWYEEPLNLLIRRKFKSKDAAVGMQATLFQIGARR